MLALAKVQADALAGELDAASHATSPPRVLGADSCWREVVGAAANGGRQGERGGNEWRCKAVPHETRPSLDSLKPAFGQSTSVLHHLHQLVCHMQTRRIMSWQHASDVCSIEHATVRMPQRQEG
eukprot:365638-Chlamydomonas_euryale.AAC.7